MSLTVSKGDDFVVIKMPDQFNFKVHRAFRDAYKDEPSNRHYRIDMSVVEFVDSSALGMLLLLWQHCGENKDYLRIVNCRPEVRRIFQVAHFEDFFNFD